MIAEIAAGLFGGALPLLGLAALTRWRIADTRRRSEEFEQRRTSQRTGRKRARFSLDWLRGSIAEDESQPERSQPVSAAVVCPHCHYTQPPSVFCRRCGTRMHKPGSGSGI